MGVRDVCIDLSGADVAVAKEGLDGTDVCAVHEQIGSEAVPEGVRGNMFSNAGGAGVFFDDTLDTARGEAAEIARGVNGLLVFAVIEKKSG